MKTSFLVSLLSLFTLATISAADQDGFKPLFNGKDFTGWEQHSGAAKYRVENGAVVGQTVAGTENSFLCTTRKFGDFILKLEFKGDHIQSWINSVKAADFKDSMTLKGIIALQVHGIGNKKEKEGEEVSWRNILIKEL